MAKKTKDPNKPKRTDVGPGKPPKEHQFKPGNNANPLGCAANPERRALMKLTQEALIECIQMVFTGTERDARAVLNDPNATLGHKVILRAALDAAKNGNYDKFNSILERVIGKVPQKLDMTSKGMHLNIQPTDAASVKQLMKSLEDEY